MTKPVQVIKGWRYPCDKNIFHFGKSAFTEQEFLEIECDFTPMKTRKGMLVDECTCGGECKPQQIKITVEVVEKGKTK